MNPVVLLMLVLCAISNSGTNRIFAFAQTRHDEAKLGNDQLIRIGANSVAQSSDVSVVAKQKLAKFVLDIKPNNGRGQRFMCQYGNAQPDIFAPHNP